MDLKRIYGEFVQKYNDEVDINSNVLIIDGLNLFIRAFSVVPIVDDNGYHIGGTSGFIKSLGFLIKSFNPSRLIVTFDGLNGSIRRRKLYPEYKENRRLKLEKKFNRFSDVVGLEDEAESLRRQLLRLFEYCSLLPVNVLTIDGIEADDTIAYIAKSYYKDKNSKLIVVSTDRDYLQLVNDNITVYNPIRKIVYTPEKVSEEYNIGNYNYLLYRVITGDKSDNIPGVKGIGLKSLMKYFDFNNPITMNEMFTICEGQVNSKAKIYSDIINNKDLIELNYKLMQLSDVDIPMHCKMTIINNLDNPPYRLNTDSFKKMAMQDGLYNAINNIPEWLYKTFLKLNSYAR